MKLQSPPHKYINAGTEKKDKIIGLPATTIGRYIGPLYGLQRKTGFQSSASGQTVLLGVTTALTDKGPLASENRWVTLFGSPVQ